LFGGQFLAFQAASPHERHTPAPKHLIVTFKFYRFDVFTTSRLFLGHESESSTDNDTPRHQDGEQGNPADLLPKVLYSTQDSKSAGFVVSA
jgi:hypothetical protein